MNSYLALREKHSKEINAFPFIFAFSKPQLYEGMKKLGLDPSETDKLYSYGGGGYYRKTDAPMLKEMGQRHNKEMRDAIASDTTGDGFLYEMFKYELANHEYVITYDVDDTLDACSLTLEEVEANPIMMKALALAKRDYMAEANL